MKAKAIIVKEEFTPKELLLTFETPEQMAKFYAIFNHAAIVDNILQDDAGAEETRRELTYLLPEAYDLCQKHLDKLSGLLREDWRDV